MKSTLIINFSYSEMPCNAEFCVGLSTFPGIVFFLLMTTLFAKYFKMVSVKGVHTTDGGVHYLTKGG